MEKRELDARIAEVSKSILSYCMSRTSDQQDAEDLAQDILCELVRSAQNIRDERAFYGFMWSVARNVYKQWCRKKQSLRECELTDDLPDESETDGVSGEQSDVYLLRRELSLLSEKYRRATVLYYLENKSCSEISDLLQISESMVKYLLFKARKLLKEGMHMERNYGEQSYNPKTLQLLFMGEGSNHYWNLINEQKIRQNILWACYNDSLTEEEIALQIGVSLPYIENDIRLLTDAWLLKKDGKHYRTNIILLSEEFDREKASKLLPLQQKIAQELRAFVDEKEPELRAVGFSGSDMTLASLRWHMVTMLLLSAYQDALGGLFRDELPPETAFGTHAYLCGVESFKGGFNICGIDAEEWNTSVSLFFMDWIERSSVSHNDFYGSRKWVRMYEKIVRGDTEGLNEFEQEIAAEMVRKGYAYVKDGGILPTVPVYTKQQREAMRALQAPVVQELAACFQTLRDAIAEILKNHVPTHLKSQVQGIASMCLFNDGTYVPALQLTQNGYLSTDWVPNELATMYAVLAE